MMLIEISKKIWVKLTQKLELDFGLFNTENRHLFLNELPKNLEIKGTNNNMREFIQSGEVATLWNSPEVWGKLLFAVLIFLGILVGLSKVLSPKRINADKSTAYECGFAPFFIKEGIIEIQFVVVALLFLIFDLEVVYLVPVTLNLATTGSQILGLYLGYMYIAIAMLMLEGHAGALSWPTWLILSDRKNNE